VGTGIVNARREKAVGLSYQTGGSRALAEHYSVLIVAQMTVQGLPK